MQEIDSYIISRKQQGADTQTIKQEMLASGWDAATADTILQQHAVSKKRAVSANRRFVAIGLILCIAIVLLGLFFVVRSLGNSDNRDPDDITLLYAPYGSGDNTQTLENFCQMSVVFPSKWTTDDGTTDANERCRMSFFTYDRSAVRTELEADGRLPSNANFWHDVEPRELETYPFSLDSIYEIQINHTSFNESASSIQDIVDAFTTSFNGEQQEIQNLVYYTFDDREVADYITPSDGTFKTQRKIVVVNNDLDQAYRITINYDQSRKEIDQTYIDELDRFISTLTFQ